MAYEARNTLIDELEGINTTVLEILREPVLTVRGRTSPVRQGSRTVVDPSLRK
jgi:hypothetical protein